MVAQSRDEHRIAPSISLVVATPPVAWPPTETVPAVSIIVPTRNEAATVHELLRRLGTVTVAIAIEVIFVDDSDDDTPTTLASLRERSAIELTVVHRPPGERAGGLGSAVVQGLRLAKAPLAIVMDADLQHPPEIIPHLLLQARQSSADLVIASRYCETGDAASFGQLRSLVSRGSTVAARFAFPGRLRSVSDPMSGFFLVRKSAIDLDALRPRGFKILLEIVARTPRLRIAEVPFRFGERFAGESKASLGEGVRFLRLLLDLRISDISDTSRRFVRFGIVGLSGVIVNLAVLAVATDELRLFYLISAVLAAELSTGWNFALTELWVFRGRRHNARRFNRGVAFFAVNNAALGLTAPIMFLLTSILGLHYLLSSLVAIGGLMVLRFAMADRLIWRTPALKRARVAA